MKLNSQDLKKIAELTLDCHNQNAEDFWEGTRNLCQAGKRRLAQALLKAQNLLG